MNDGLADRPRNGLFKKPSIWGTVLLGVLVCGSWRSDAADDAAVAHGLRGILPAEVPAEFSEIIATLPENWQKWGEGLAAELTDLYEKTDADVATQRKTLAALRARLKTMQTSLADPRYRSIFDSLIMLSGQLSRRVDLAEAVLDTTEITPEARAALRAEAQTSLRRAAQALADYLGGIQLGAGWASYVQVQAVSALATGNADAAKTVELLTAVQAKFRDKGKLADPNAREFLTRPLFATYEQAVNRSLDLEKRRDVAANSPELRATLGELVAALERYELSNGKADSAAARKAYDAARQLAADGGDRLVQVLRTDFMNYNLRVTATEAFLNRFVKKHMEEQGPVSDVILGVPVAGTQRTDTDVSLDLVPSPNQARFDITVNGHVNSSTQGMAQQATIYTQGNHYFTATKEVVFDGDKFATRPARISVRANNTTTGAQTSYSGGLFGGMADRIAMREAEARRGDSEAIAASRVQDQVLPKFNQEVDKEFNASSPATRELQGKLNALRELGLFPDARALVTSSDHLYVVTRLMNAEELGGTTPSTALAYGPGLTVQVHESVVNNSLDRMDLKGKTLAGDELAGEFEKRLSTLLGRPVKLPAAPAEPDADKVPLTLIFDATDPIRIRFDKGLLYVIVRAAFKRNGEEIPAQTITAQIKLSIKGDKLIAERSAIEVSPVVRPTGGGIAQQITRAGVIKKKFEQALPVREFDRSIAITRDKSTVKTSLTQILALDGWMTILFQ